MGTENAPLTPMEKPNASQIDAARRLIAREARSEAGAEERAAAAGRVYETIVAHLATLVGLAAARALVARSIKLTAPDFACLANVPLAVGRSDDLGAQLVLCLRDQAPDTVTDATIALYATLLALLGTLIGERLTAKVLRDSWPALSVVPPKEETK